MARRRKDRHTMEPLLSLDVQGRTFRKASASGAQNDCVYLPASGSLDAVHDSKSGATLRMPARQLVAFARTR